MNTAIPNELASHTRMLSGLTRPSEAFASALATTPTFKKHGCNSPQSVIDLYHKCHWQYQELCWYMFKELTDDEVDAIYRSLGTTLEEERKKCVVAIKWLASKPGWEDFGQFTRNATVAT